MFGGYSMLVVYLLRLSWSPLTICLKGINILLFPAMSSMFWTTAKHLANIACDCAFVNLPDFCTDNTECCTIYAEQFHNFRIPQSSKTLLRYQMFQKKSLEQAERRQQENIEMIVGKNDNRFQESGK